MRDPNIRASSWCAAALLLSFSAEAQPLTLEAAVARALEKNPEVNRAATEVLAANAQLEGAARWVRSNPRLSAGAGPRTTPGGQELNLSVELVQSLEVAGQRGARVDAAEAALLGARASVERQRAEIAARTRIGFADVLALEAQVRVLEEAVAFTGKSVQAVRDRMEAGASTQIDLNAALVDLGRVQRELLLARQALVDRRGELRLLVAFDPGEELELAGALEAVVATIVPRELALPDATALALEQRPDVRAARAALEAAEAHASVARREAVPTPEVGVGYEREGDEQVVQGLIGFALPVFDRNQAERGAAAARVLRARIELETTERQVPVEIGAALRRHAAAREAVELYRQGINEAAEQGVVLVQEGYRAGKLDLFQLLLIQRNALDARAGYIEALAELAEAAARLNLAMGSAS